MDESWFERGWKDLPPRRNGAAGYQEINEFEKTPHCRGCGLRQVLAPSEARRSSCAASRLGKRTSAQAVQIDLGGLEKSGPIGNGLPEGPSRR